MTRRRIRTLLSIGFSRLTIGGGLTGPHLTTVALLQRLLRLRQYLLLLLLLLFFLLLLQKLQLVTQILFFGLVSLLILGPRHQFIILMEQVLAQIVIGNWLLLLQLAKRVDTVGTTRGHGQVRGRVIVVQFHWSGLLCFLRRKDLSHFVIISLPNFF